MKKRKNDFLNCRNRAEEFGPSKYSMAIWVKQAIPIIIKGQSKTLKDVKQLEKGLAILEEKNAILKRAAILLAKKYSVMWDFPLVNQFLT
ncbi:hypothetical protein LCIT_06580 [Leuconostoc citreum]|uniref:Transposase n=1 Tax=Leuconostoc citreum TaxID=33964 RepID=A0A5A5U052_LEUCI|nr:hypothetical protein [Leuconostoc citreum]GDZ83416.1 hypothetical protein LCIT_06580 [Leuconostoc citreum]